MSNDEQTLPKESSARKALPVTSGVIDYFPAALVEIAKVSKYGNDKHNPGEPLHWTRGKSNDHADAIGRHLIDRGKIDPDTGVRHSAELAWRALALLQVELEEAGEAPLPRGAVAAEPTFAEALAAEIAGLEEDAAREKAAAPGYGNTVELAFKPCGNRYSHGPHENNGGWCTGRSFDAT